MDVNIIRKNYSEFSNDKIETIASTKGASLPKEVVGVLNEEIRKRGLSPNLEIDFERIDTERKDRVQRAHNQLMHGHNKFYQESSGSTWLVIGVGILMFMACTIITSLVANFIGRSLSGIAQLASMGFAGKLLFDYGNNKPTMVETFDDHIVVAQNPYLSFGKIGRLIAMIKLFRNKLTRVTLPYQNIERIYQKDGIWDANIYIVANDGKGRRFEFPSALLLLDYKRDLPKVLKILKAKGVTNISADVYAPIK